jgi:hypothetical protein
MSKLSTLIGKPKTFKIGEIELELKPRTLGDLDLIFDLQDDAKRGTAMKKLIKDTLKDAVPDATEEELNGMSFKYFKELSNAIVEVNGLDATSTTN